MLKLITGSFDDFRQDWQYLYSRSSARVLFSSSGWSELWWSHFGSASKLCLAAVMEDQEVIGIAPLRRENGTLFFIGSNSVCDFLDFIVAEGKEEPFFNTLLENLSTLGGDGLDLFSLLPDSNVRRFLVPMAEKTGLNVSCSQDDMTVVLKLPEDLPSYLSALNGKQRHEILRKERRLNEEGEITFRTINRPSITDIDIFLLFFRESREDKNRFLTETMEAFFRDVVSLAASTDMLSMGLLELNNSPVAATLSFIYRNDVYLYNSGYNPDYRWLSVGVLSKYLRIKQSIEEKRGNFDFLRGGEKYKFHLGGTEAPLFRCIIKNRVP